MGVPKAMIGLALLLCVAGPCRAQEASRSNATGLGWDLTADFRSAWWWTSDDDDDDPLSGNAIDYETPAMLTWTVTAALTWRQDRVLGVSVQRPFQAESAEREVLVRMLSPTVSIEDYAAFLQLPFLKSLGDRPWLTLTSGLQLEYRLHYFFGSGRSLMVCMYAGGESDRIVLDPDDWFRFMASFEDWNLSLPLFQGPEGSSIRLGAFRSLIRKPHETILSVDTPHGRGPLIVETRMTSWGPFLSIDSIPFGALLRLGAVQFEPQGNVDEYGLFATKKGSFDFLLHIRWSPTFRLARGRTDSRRSGLFLKPLLGVELRWDYLNSDTSGLGIDDFELSANIVVDGGLRLEWYY